MKPLKWMAVGFCLAWASFLSLFFVAAVFSKLAVIELFLAMMPNAPVSGLNILALGVDQTRAVQRSDTIMVIHIDMQERRLGVLSIPRDTRAKVEGYGLTKINHAYAHGGVKLLKGTVSELLNIPIHHFVKINLAGVEALIDQLGGVTIDVEKDLKYVDKAGGVSIDIKKGRQRLSGRQVIQFLRFRHDFQGDIGRIKRQQEFLNAFSKEIIGGASIFDFPKIVSNLGRNFSSDMSARQLIGMAVSVMDILKDGKVMSGTVPGDVALTEGVSYWIPDITRMDREVQKVIMGFGQAPPIVAEKDRVETVDPNASDAQRRKMTINEVSRIAEQRKLVDRSLKKIKPGFTVEVLNGYGKAGEARFAAHRIKTEGVKVPRFGNAGSYQYAETLIVDWKGNLDSAVALAQYLFIDPSRIIVYDKPEKNLDATLVLGKDWDAIKQKLLDDAKN